ncbi:hypothetical protein G6F60_015016 [Rhizopus arrhizus]|nr:hypothetical protein G6F60_015016 [Rhizopus arrhizus]
MTQAGHVVQLRRHLQSLADTAAIVAVQREQMQLQRRVVAQLLEQGHGQQPGGMGAESVGEETNPQRALGTHRYRWQRPAARRRRRLR